MERIENESQLAFAKRATELYADKVIDAQEWASSLLGEDYRNVYSDEYVRRASTFFKIFLESIKDENELIPADADEDYLEHLEEVKDSLIKERTKLQDANRQKRGALREEARFENLCDILRESIKNLKPLECESGWMLPDDAETKYAILCLSDWHCGMTIDSQFNFYNVDVMKERANVVVEKAISYCCQHEVTDLVVEVNGDLLDGSIHISSRVQQEQDVIQQIMTVSETLSECIDKLAPWFKTVKVYATLGNHGRLCSKKTDCVTKENFEMLIPEFMRLRLKGHDNVTIVDSKGLDFLKYQVGDKIICMAHGQNDSINRVAEDFSKIYKQVPDEVHVAHYHSYRDIADCDIMVNVNGSLCGADDYALSIRKINAPAQNLIVYDHDRCVYSLKADE